MAQASAGRGRVVFLTDGLPDIPGWQSSNPPPRELAAYVEETLALVEAMGQPVLTVALGDEVDRAFLQAISEASQGRYFEAAAALDLPAVYLELLSALQDRSVVDVGQIASPGETKVDIHPYAQQVGFVVVKDPAVEVMFYPPGTGEPLDLTTPGIVAFREPQFEVIVVSDLLPGPWQVALSGSGQADVKAIVINSRLQLDLLSPTHGTACVGQPWFISARLSLIDRAGLPTPLARAEAPATISAQVTLPDGQQTTLTLHDEGNQGQFTAFFDLTNQAGNYQIALLTDATSLKVRRTAEVTARSCPGLALVAPQHGDSIEVLSDQPIVIEAQLAGGEDLLLEEGGVVVLLTDTTGNSVTLALLEKGRGQYQGEFWPETSGPVEIQARLDHAVWQGLHLEGDTEPAWVTISLLPPDPWTRYRVWGWLAAIALGSLALLQLMRWARRPRLEGELIYGPPGEQPDYEPVRGSKVYLKVEEEHLMAGRSRREAQALLRAEGYSQVRVMSYNGVRLMKNNLPVPQAGSLIGPQDVIQLEGLDIRFENYGEE
jgi:hypothetical protein